MQIRLKIDHSEYLLSSGNNAKLIEFAGMFFDPNIKIEKIDTHYIDVDDSNTKKMSVADLQAIKLYCQEAHINTFQSHETSKGIGISMADKPLRTKTPVQEGLEKLITKAVSKPKLVEPSA